MIIRCTCIHPDQDRIHGLGNRVFNECRGTKVRCTVCKNEKEISGRPIKEHSNDRKNSHK